MAVVLVKGWQQFFRCSGSKPVTGGKYVPKGNISVLCSAKPECSVWPSVSPLLTDSIDWFLSCKRRKFYSASECKWLQCAFGKAPTFIAVVHRLKTYYNYTGLKAALKSKLSYLEAKAVEMQTDLDQSQIWVRGRRWKRSQRPNSAESGHMNPNAWNHIGNDHGGGRSYV